MYLYFPHSPHFDLTTTLPARRLLPLWGYFCLSRVQRLEAKLHCFDELDQVSSCFFAPALVGLATPRSTAQSDYMCGVGGPARPQEFSSHFMP